MSQLPPVLAPREEDVAKMLACHVHLGTRNLDPGMEQYVWKRRNDGFYLIDLKKTWEKLVFAARVIVAIEDSKDVALVSARPYGQRAILKFATATDTNGLAGRFTPGTFTNQIQKNFVEPRLLIATDPRTDHQPLRESSYVNVPTVAFCHTDAPLRYVDIAIPANNKGKHAIGLMYWLLAREVLYIRGSSRCNRQIGWDVMVDMFFYRDPEEVERDAEAALAQQQAAQQAQQNAYHQAQAAATAAAIAQQQQQDAMATAANVFETPLPPTNTPQPQALAPQTQAPMQQAAQQQPQQQQQAPPMQQQQQLAPQQQIPMQAQMGVQQQQQQAPPMQQQAPMQQQQQAPMMSQMQPMMQQQQQQQSYLPPQPQQPYVVDPNTGAPIATGVGGLPPMGVGMGAPQGGYMQQQQQPFVQQQQPAYGAPLGSAPANAQQQPGQGWDPSVLGAGQWDAQQ